MSTLASPILCRRAAMNTWFEIILLGDDEENITAMGEAALDEIVRVEKLLSRFDPASEVSRLNREAAQHPVLVDLELAAILETCALAWKQTEGYFDIAIRPEKNSRFSEVKLISPVRLVLFQSQDVRLDFGGFGKGYALDCAAKVLREYGVKQALLHGGTSSVLAIGGDGYKNGWRIGLRNPWKKGEEINPVFLNDNALSSSATGGGISDILSPHSNKPIQIQAACNVIAATAAQAEIFSTALLCMGKEKASAFLAENPELNLVVYWTENSAAPNTVQL